MYQYNYTREIVSGSFDINNKQYLDIEGKVVSLAKYLKEVMPTKIFKMKCFGTTCQLFSNIELTEQEHTDLTGFINTYKNYTG